MWHWQVIAFRAALNKRQLRVAVINRTVDGTCSMFTSTMTNSSSMGKWKWRSKRTTERQRTTRQTTRRWIAKSRDINRLLYFLLYWSWADALAKSNLP